MSELSFSDVSLKENFAIGIFNSLKLISYY